MTESLMNINQLFSLLEGTWIGEGRGEFPGITSFNYRETLTFTMRDKDWLEYEQKTEKLYDGQTEYLPSHDETGSIRLLETSQLQLVNTQAGGRSEVLLGVVENLDDLIRIRFTSKSISKDPRMIFSARTFDLEGDTLRYEMGMHTTKVEQLRPHVKIALQRVK